MPRQGRFVFVLLCLLWARALAEPTVRVLLDEVPGRVTVRIEGPHQGYVDARLRFETSFSLDWPIQARSGGIWVDGQRLGASLTLAPQSGLVRWQGKEYRGALSFVAKGDFLEIVNLVAVEAYLRGVVPAEVPASWPMAALRAQAVAARTYTLVSMDPDAGYDICATQDCQVYGGVAAEHPRSDRAVADTRGLVLTYGGRLAKTYYHADSGGYLASSAEVWDQALPYLPAKPDAAGAAPATWTQHLDAGRIAASLVALGLDVGAVSSLEVLEKSASGRVLRAAVNGRRGRVVLEGATLRTLLRSWGLLSTRFRMSSALAVTGTGRGHGVGMSQVGARRLAEQGYGFEQILAYYYPSTVLQALPPYQSAAQ